MESEENILNKIFPHPEYLREIWEKSLSTEEHIVFFCHCLVYSIDAFRRGDYLTFDAHTTSKCCHGIALFGRILFLAVSRIDLTGPYEEALRQLSENRLSDRSLLEKLDWRLLVLMSMSVLSSIGELDPVLGRRTLYYQMKKIGPISCRIAKELGSDLQKFFSNAIAFSYAHYVDEIHDETSICGASVKLWGRYVQPEFFRTTIRKVVCVPCLFSTQVVLAYLIKSKAKVALVNDLVDQRGEWKERYVNLFEGDGVANLEMVGERVQGSLEEPVVVFSGCVFSDRVDACSLKNNMIPWERRVPNLILACDVFYPQFPSVSIDPNFDSSPIEPHEDELKAILKEHGKIGGVSAEDSSLFCLTHIFSTSLQHIQKELRGERVLPNGALHIPKKLVRYDTIASNDSESSNKDSE